MDTVVTRFAPSPSGYLHVGGARTAIFNWLYARHVGGKFILRIEDTDLKRSTRESVDTILDALVWLGIDWDEGPHFQSQRMEIYLQHIDRLVDSGTAYFCDCSSQRLETMRKSAMAAGANPRYDGACRHKNLKRSADTVVRFITPQTGTTVVRDVIRGEMVFQNSEFDDFIIQRSSGTPTYNFVVVVDDLTMGVNTIIRGDDHISNTPKQILLYKALKAELPIFGHVPMVLGRDRSRLSKRHGAMSVTAYREKGYLAEAVINYLVRLAWSYGDQEFFSVKELVEKFSLKNIGRSAGIFDPDKLLALNADHIQATSPSKLAAMLPPFLEPLGVKVEVNPHLEKIVATLHKRSKTLCEMAEGALFYYQPRITYEDKAAKKFLKANSAQPMEILLAELEALEEFSEASLEKAFLKTMDLSGLKLGKIAQPVRVALTGKTASPGIFEIIAILGKDVTLQRIRCALDYIRAA